MISLPGFQQRAASTVLLGWESGRVQGGVGSRVKGALSALFLAELSWGWGSRAQEVGIPALIMRVCVCVRERERSVVKLWNFEHVYESMDIPICPIDIPICPFWVKPAHSFWTEKATLLTPSPLSAWCNRKRGFGISRPQVSVCWCFLCSFIHLWSSMEHQLCQRHSLHMLHISKNNPSFGQVVMAWVPTTWRHEEPPWVSVMRIKRECMNSM